MRQFILYCCLGFVGVSADFIAYHFALLAGAWYPLANASGYALGTTVSFFLNRALNFKVRDKTAIRLAVFFCVAAIGFIFSTTLLATLIEFFQISERLAKVTTLPLVVMIQFTLNKRLTFGLI
jgi:putative flippase GtrA